VSIHVFADMLWIGSIAVVAALIAASDPKTLEGRASAARWAYLRLSTPAFAVALVMGVVCLIADPTHSVLKLPSMHAKLTLAAGIIALHHWIGAQARQRAAGTKKAPTSPVPLALLVLAAAGAAVLGVLKPF